MSKTESKEPTPICKKCKTNADAHHGHACYEFKSAKENRADAQRKLDYRYGKR